MYILLVYILLVQQSIQYGVGFRLYLTTKLENSPEQSTKLVLLNFMITEENIKNQLLGIIVATERYIMFIFDNPNNKLECKSNTQIV